MTRVENPADEERVEDEGDDAHLGAAAWAGQGVDFIDASDELSPAKAKHKAGGRVLTGARYGRRCSGGDVGVGVIAASTRPHDGGISAEVADQM